MSPSKSSDFFSDSHDVNLSKEILFPPPMSKEDYPNMLVHNGTSRLNRILKLPQVPSKIPTKRPKSSGRVLTSVENLKVLEEKEQQKQQKK